MYTQDMFGPLGYVCPSYAMISNKTNDLFAFKLLIYIWLQ